MAQGIIPKIIRLIIRLLYFLITYHAKKKKKRNHCAEHVKVKQYCKSTILHFLRSVTFKHLQASPPGSS